MLFFRVFCAFGTHDLGSSAESCECLVDVCRGMRGYPSESNGALYMKQKLGVEYCWNAWHANWCDLPCTLWHCLALKCSILVSWGVQFAPATLRTSDCLKVRELLQTLTSHHPASSQRRVWPQFCYDVLTDGLNPRWYPEKYNLTKSDGLYSMFTTLEYWLRQLWLDVT